MPWEKCLITHFMSTSLHYTLSQARGKEKYSRERGSTLRYTHHSGPMLSTVLNGHSTTP